MSLRYFIIFLIFLMIQSAPVKSQGTLIKVYYDNDKTVVKEEYYVNDTGDTPLLEGPYKSYFISGAVESTGYYKNNIPDSLWSYFYENGQPKMKGNLRDGQNYGIWEYFYENGTMSMKGPIYSNIRDGSWEYYYENGQMKMQGDFKNNLKEGIWNYFYEDGSIKAQAYFKANRGWYKEFYPTEMLKAEGLNVNGKSDSTWTFYHESGAVKATGDYKDGKRSGTWLFYHDNGIKSAEGNYLKGHQEGKWTYYHENGAISSEGALREDKKEGYWKIFNDEGNFIAEGIFERNDGKYNEFYESGNLKAEGYIEDGKNHGQWYYYFEDGNLEGQCLFTHGTGEYVGYYEDGIVKMKGEIKDGVNTGIWELYNGDGSLAGYYRPYYEDDKPIYKLIEQADVEKVDYTKPAYKYKNYKVRYFDAVINEYQGIIIATNPLGMLVGRLPLSAEYYFQERLGYEVQVQLLRNPFFKSSDKVTPNSLYERGFDVALKQKFYHPEGKFGMFYFGHEVRLTSLKHYANVLDSSMVEVQQVKLKEHETRFEYSVIVGDRWMTIYGERWRRNSVGITIDAFIGLGIGYRLLTPKYSSEPAYDEIFDDLNDSNFVFSPRLGLNIGIVF